MKKILLLLLSISILTACNQQTEQTDTLHKNDAETTDIAITESTAIKTETECSADIPVYFNNSLITEQEIEQHELLHRVHLKSFIEKKSQLALQHISSHKLNIAYSTFTADFDADGNEEAFIAQKWYADSDDINLTSVWYCDLLCSEIYSDVNDCNEVFTINNNGKDFLCIVPELMDNSPSPAEIFTFYDGDIIKCACKNGELHLDGTETVINYDNSYISASWSETVGRFTADRQPPVTTFDETDEILTAGREFAEAYAEMYWNYLCGGAWDDYINTAYFDFEDKSEGNYYEYEGRPFYKLLITEYSYDELIVYIKSFYTDEAYGIIKDSFLFIGHDNCIYVNGTEPTFLYGMRNKRANIIGYTQNNDGTITYNCFAETTEQDEEDLYFSFTLSKDGRLCGEFISSELGLFSDIYY